MSEEDVECHSCVLSAAKSRLISPRMVTELGRNTINQAIEPQINLPPVTRCPGCFCYVPSSEYSSMTVTEDCAKHLFERCIKIKSVEARHKTIKWILSYLTRSESRRLSDCSCHLNLIEKNCKSALLLKSKKWWITVPATTVMHAIRCPVCDQYFPHLDSCYYHIFQSCLSTPTNSKDAVDVMYWLEEFFLKHKGSLGKLNLLYGADKDCFVESSNTNLINTTNFTCKYCNAGFHDENSLRLHFRTKHNESPHNYGVICFLCDFKAPDDEKLGRHFLTRHLKCGCQNFTDHFGGSKCGKSQSVPCPICDESFNIESHFISHVIECRPTFEETPMKIEKLFSHCQLCEERVLITRLHEHLIKHVEEKEVRYSKNSENLSTCISVEQLKENQTFLAAEDFEELMRYFDPEL